MTGRRVAAVSALAIVLALVAAGFYVVTRTDAGRIALARLLIHAVPEPRILPTPAATSWTPDGARFIAPKNDVLGGGGIWRERHADGRNSDETLLAAAPTFGKARIIAPDELHFTALSFDRNSNIYATVNFATDGTFLVSYDIETGRERWRLKSTGHPPLGGVPIVLEGPDRGGETVYLMSRDEALAVRTDGTILWRTPTGLPPVETANVRESIMWSPSYNPRLDAITGISASGELVAFDRKTGKLLTPKPLLLPGAPSPSQDLDLAPGIVAKMADGYRAALGRPVSADIAKQVISVVEGDSVKIANYHSVDPATGRMWLTATAPDEADGKKDGVSEFGALYGLDLVRSANGALDLEIGCHAYFQNGSASTPGLRADGMRVYIADGLSNLMAYDSDCRKLWSLDVGGQVVASPSVATDNDEVYVVTTSSLLKVIDDGTSAHVAWTAGFDMYDAPFPLVQKSLLTAAITANGIYAEAGIGVLTHVDSNRPRFLPLRTGGVRLDRKTGKVLAYGEETADSVAVTEIAPNGSLVVPQSPLRSIMAGVIFPGLAAKTTGGIAVFAPDRQDLMARDAVCAAARLFERAEAVAAQGKAEESASYLAQAKLLADQAASAAAKAGVSVDAGTDADLQAAAQALDAGLAPGPSSEALHGQLNAACRHLEASSAS